MRNASVFALLLLVAGCARRNPDHVADVGAPGPVGGSGEVDLGEPSGSRDSDEDMAAHGGLGGGGGGAADLAVGADLAGSTCACQPWQLCTPKGCVLDPASRWIVRDASFSLAATAPGGAAWDLDLSAPDPYLVCARDGKELTRTDVVQDAYLGAWPAGAICRATAADLLAGKIVLKVYDADPGQINGDDFAGATSDISEIDLASMGKIGKQLSVGDTAQQSWIWFFLAPEK